MRCQEYIKVRFHDTDHNKIAKLSSVVQFMQEAASQHLIQQGPTPDEIRSTGNAFILARMSVQLYAPLYTNDELISTTWVPQDSKSLTFSRCYRLSRGEEVVAEAEAVWALVDMSTKKPIFTTEYHGRYNDEELVKVDVLSKVRIPKTLELSLVGEHIVVYSDLDDNMHMNNCKYGDLICNVLPSLNKKRISSYSITFLNEALLGQELKFYLGEYEDKYYIRSINHDGKINIEAEIQLEDL